MGWLKDIVDPATGVIVGYWDVKTAFHDHQAMQNDFVVGGWVDKKAFDAGYAPVIIKTVHTDAIVSPQLASAVYSFVKTYFKALPEFSGAQDG